MRVIYTKTGVVADVSDEYGARLIEQCVAQIAPAPEKKDKAPGEKPAKPEKKK